MQSSAERSIVKILKKKIDFLLDTTYQRLHSYKMPEPGLQLTAPASKLMLFHPGSYCLLNIDISAKDY